MIHDSTGERIAVALERLVKIQEEQHQMYLESRQHAAEDRARDIRSQEILEQHLQVQKNIQELQKNIQERMQTHEAQCDARWQKILQRLGEPTH